MKYLKEVGQEMRKVTWPSFGEVNHFTWIVIMMIIFSSLYFTLTDTAFSWLMNWFLKL